jgi:uncharacterized protein DUF4230
MKRNVIKMRFLKKILLVLVVIIAGWWLLGKLNFLPSLSNFFASKAVVIDETITIVKEIKPLAQLVTVSAYDEIVVDSSVSVSGRVNFFQPLYPMVIPPGRFLDKTIVIIGKTVTHVGIDMEKLRAGDIHTTKDSLYITLPKAQILDIILNPSDVEIFIEKGEWDNATITKLKNRIDSIAEEHALQKGLLAESEKKAIEIMTRFFAVSGKKVQVDFR